MTGKRKPEDTLTEMLASFEQEVLAQQFPSLAADDLLARYNGRLHFIGGAIAALCLVRDRQREGDPLALETVHDEARQLYQSQHPDRVFKTRKP